MHEGLCIDEVNMVFAAFKKPQVAIASWMHKTMHSARAALVIDKQRCGDLVPIPGIVPVILMCGDDLAGFHIDGEH